MNRQTNEQIGYIYIYKCIVGKASDFCKIGMTEHFRDKYDRITQHERTPYYGFIPYMDFATGNAIVTAFKVKNIRKTDRLVKERFKNYQVGKIEIYNIDYDKAIKELYDYLKETNQFIELIKDGISIYKFLDKKEFDDLDPVTSKAKFEMVLQQILKRYGNNLPEEFLSLLREKKEFEEHCPSHTQFIEIHPYDLVLDIHFNKSKRTEIMNKLQDLL